MPRFGPLDGLLQLALQALACYGALRLAGPRGSGALRRWGGLTLACLGCAFIVHIAAFAALARLLPGAELRPLRRISVAVVWTLTCSGCAWLLGRRWQLAAPAQLAGWCALCSGAAYGAFVGIEALLGRQ
jgi:hypothetical protein